MNGNSSLAWVLFRAFRPVRSAWRASKAALRNSPQLASWRATIMTDAAIPFLEPLDVESAEEAGETKTAHPRLKKQTPLQLQQRRRRRRLVWLLVLVLASGLVIALYEMATHGSSLAHGGDVDVLSPPPPSDDLDYDEGTENTDDTDNSTDATGKTGTPDCLPHEMLLRQMSGKKSAGQLKLPYARPPPACRTFRLAKLERQIARMKKTIRDPDLFRLFENAYPMTLDTMVKWQGYANRTDEEGGEPVVTDEELSYVITGDIDAMWLRDSAAQILAYRSLLGVETVKTKKATDVETKETDVTKKETGADGDLERLWRGLINAQARGLIASPYCHSFQPPPESGILPSPNGANAHNRPRPGFNPKIVFDCKWELDSPAFFLLLSAEYYERTGDAAFFRRYRWIEAVQAIVEATEKMRVGTYDEAGHVLDPGYTFTGWTNRGSETLTNDGYGNPVRANGMVRSSFRPSDDACIFQYLVPANMLWAASLERAAVVMELIGQDDGDKTDKKADKAEKENQAKTQQAAALAPRMRQFAAGVREGIAKDAVVEHRDFGPIFAYEVDGYGGANLMDDANMPSLLSIPLLSYFRPGDATAKKVGKGNNLLPARVYANTRRFALSPGNPYYAWGEPGGLAAIGGPHTGPGMAWPMAAVVAGLTADVGDDAYYDYEVSAQLRMLLNSTDGSGVLHESINVWRPMHWTRAWFGWANGLFGELILSVAEHDAKKPEGKRMLSRSWQ